MIRRSHRDCVHGLAASGDGRPAVSASYHKTLRDLETGALIVMFTCDAAVDCCGFIADDELIAGDALGRAYFLTLEEPKRKD